MASKLKQICDGWTNLFFVNEEVEQIAMERLDKCESCGDIQYINKKMHLYPHCSHCKCFIPAMIRSLDKKCPKGNF